VSVTGIYVSGPEHHRTSAASSPKIAIAGAAAFDFKTHTAELKRKVH
jgi:hypothetical protein